MAVVELAIQDQENGVFAQGKKWVKVRGKCDMGDIGKTCTVIHKRCNNLCLWPLCPRIEFFSVLVPPALVRNRDFREVVVQHCLVEVHDELLWLY